MAIQEYEILTELTNFLRNNDILSTSERGVTTTTQTFNGDDITTTFDLTHKNLKNIREIEVNSVPLNYGVDYSIEFEGSDSGRITFVDAPITGVDNIVVTYDYGASDRIYPDLPRLDLKLNSYPRIGFRILDVVTQPMAIGGKDDISFILIEVIVYALSVKQSSSIGEVMRDLFRDNKQEFHYFRYITPKNIGPTIISPERNNEIVQRNYIFEIKNHFED